MSISYSVMSNKLKQTWHDERSASAPNSILILTSNLTPTPNPDPALHPDPEASKSLELLLEICP